ncbi:lytic transglycosylase domain-containing protein [Deinococcus lacus]|uniref:Lytic transglycosylase domain-containing protein n=1 Tax=Deinococcus lacus TaxID=392561 RepID=A0ABW1YEU6_9DEIO
MRALVHPKTLGLALLAASAWGSAGAYVRPAPVLTTQPSAALAVPASRCAPHERGQLVRGPAGQRMVLPRQYAAWTLQSARAEGIPPALLIALIWHESQYCAQVISVRGAIGLGQLMPGTAQALGVNPYHPQQNIAGAARYLGQQLQTFRRVDLALAAYNAGPGRVQGCGCVPPVPETQRYVTSILNMYRGLSEK